MSYRTECAGKHPHKSKGSALAHVRALERRFPNTEPRVPYPCRFCKCWHVGRLPKKKKG